MLHFSLTNNSHFMIHDSSYPYPYKHLSLHDPRFTFSLLISPHYLINVPSFPHQKLSLYDPRFTFSLPISSHCLVDVASFPHQQLSLHDPRFTFFLLISRHCLKMLHLSLTKSSHFMIQDSPFPY